MIRQAFTSFENPRRQNNVFPEYGASTHIFPLTHLSLSSPMQWLRRSGMPVTTRSHFRTSGVLVTAAETMEMKL